jgi:sterol desaturase/sphingolipid hydroxylase (fatty acid hydroxylase superfamily)
MKMGKLGYFSEFLFFPLLVLAATLMAFRSSIPPQPAICAIVYGGGLVGWTLIEYLLHRVLFHHAPILSQIHERHHNSPQDLIGTPAWASVLLGLIAVASPSWAILGFDLGTAATAGLVTGYLWYASSFITRPTIGGRAGILTFTGRACAMRATTIYPIAAISA